FFFFQAEDGIRDGHVTGVQTCALPIFVAQAAGMKLSLAQQVPILLTLMLTSKGAAGVPRAGLVVLSGTLTTFGLPMEGVAVVLRSEERRVGKECRAGWWT